MTRAIVVAMREVQAYLRDRGDLAFSLLLPIVTFALIYGAFGGSGMFHGTAYIVNEDGQGAYATLLIDKLDEMDSLDVELLTMKQATSKLERSDLQMVIHIPDGFSSRLASDQPAQLIFKQRGNGGQEGQIVASLVRGAIEEINREFQVKQQVIQALKDTDILSAGIELTVQEFIDRESEYPLIGINARTVGSKPDPVNEYLPGIITMYVLFAITLGARVIVEERRKGTLERLLTTRLTGGELFVGKFLANIMRGFVQTVILLVLGYIVFQIFTPLSFLECLVITLVFAAAASALGMVIASIARSEDGATWVAVLITMSMVMIGGTFFPIQEGTTLEIISRASLNTYANSAFSTIITDGGSLADAALDIGILAGVAVVGLVLSRFLFRAVPGGK
ncbi:MAG: ABC transporter permease [Dehalococcoidales bacterium]|nr:MAG: ABC transporter permease [Dehalococcoidales bacterium]